MHTVETTTSSPNITNAVLGAVKRILKRIVLASHNIIGHPLMEICYIFGLRRIGNWVHNSLFKIEH